MAVKTIQKGKGTTWAPEDRALGIGLTSLATSVGSGFSIVYKINPELIFTKPVIPAIIIIASLGMAVDITANYYQRHLRE